MEEFLFREYNPIHEPIIKCSRCGSSLRVHEVNANIYIGEQEEEYICEFCYIKEHPEQYGDLDF